MRGNDAGCVSTRLGALLISPSLEEEENNVESVGCVAQSEKSTENSQ